MTREPENKQFKKPLGSTATRHAYLLLREGWWVAWEEQNDEAVEILTAPTANEILVNLEDGFRTSVDTGAERYKELTQKGE